MGKKSNLFYKPEKGSLNKVNIYFEHKNFISKDLNMFNLSDNITITFHQYFFTVSGSFLNEQRFDYNIDNLNQNIFNSIIRKAIKGFMGAMENKLTN